MSAKPWHLLNKNIKKVEKDLYSYRIGVCSKCSRIFKPTFQCLECGCFMKGKARIENASCPLGKW